MILFTSPSFLVILIDLSNRWIQSRSQVRLHLILMSKQKYRICLCFSRKFKLSVPEPPAEIKSLFEHYSENGHMTVDKFSSFLIDVQNEEKLSKEDAEAIVNNINESKHINHLFHRKDVLSVDGFFRYLFSDLNSPLCSAHEVQHDMNAPLSHYFIYTGHNSYLTGNQLSSDCSDIPIIQALHKGVRVIELDMWPNSAKDDIDVLHGRTLTTPVQLIKCLRSIKEHAFTASEYPVILTLEDHLTPDLQAKVAKMVDQIFGDMLFLAGSECLADFPSPESLKRRIIISTKPPKEYLETKIMNNGNGSIDKEQDPLEDDTWGKEVSPLKENFDAIDKNNIEDEEIDDGDKNVQQKSVSEYKCLIAIHAKKRIGQFKEWFMVESHMAQRLSLSEQALEKAVLTHHKDIIRFTQKNLLRVFPKITRFDSSNYNPLIGWMHGAQMVAFNMQGHGRSLWLMQGLFRANGGSGYVKKPDLLLKTDTLGDLFDPKATLPVKTTLKVKVYMGEGWYHDFRHTHFDKYSPPDFYVRIGIAGVPNDSVMKKTKTIADDWTPTWNEEFEFPLTVPELALLHIEVHEYDIFEKDDFGGQTCLPVSEMRSGIRAISLNDRRGDKYKSVKLLARFSFV